MRAYSYGRDHGSGRRRRSADEAARPAQMRPPADRVHSIRHPVCHLLNLLKGHGSERDVANYGGIPQLRHLVSRASTHG